MKEVFKTGAKLAVICAVAAISLGIVNAVTDPIIIAARAARLEAALQKLSLGLEIGELVEVGNDSAITGYYPLIKDGNIVAYIVKVIGAGYADDLNLLSAISLKGKILSAVLMENSETPGLGKEAENTSYMEMFVGKGDGSVIPYRKTQLDPDEADSITGASITFIGIGKALNAASEFAVKIGGM